MNHIKILSGSNPGVNFIPKKYLPGGNDEYYIREKQNPYPDNYWRKLTSEEINELIVNNNHADNWENILVTDKFTTELIYNNNFYGLIHIDNLEKALLEYNDLKLLTGITDSTIIACDIGEQCAIHNIKYLSHYIIKKNSILFNINEMQTSNNAKFGNGIIKDGESENSLNWIKIINETGGRKILPFDGIIPADAYLWAKYRDDTDLQKKIIKITKNSFDNKRGYYGIVGEKSIIKNTSAIINVKIGPSCLINETNRLENLTINSSLTEPTQIEQAGELKNGIIGYGCQLTNGCYASNFIMGDNSKLKYGARMLHTFLGDNSTISCCEVLNNLIFPLHEQHHNNSFLIAALIMGQSNLAAGATLGSNHNSRANDNEMQAKRGFWPALCSNIKYPSKFASFTLLAKSDFPAELNIPLPFSLVNNNISKNQLEIIPAFWWLYNMYALARNSWKFKNRDKREQKKQNIEFDYLAPDTIEEILKACQLLEIWTAKAFINREKNISTKELIKTGKDLLSEKKDKLNKLEILGENLEKSKRKVVILKIYKAYHAYYDMLHYYAVKNLLEYLSTNQNASFSNMVKTLKGERIKEWINLGGQIIPKKEVDKIKSEIIHENYKTWEDIHSSYNTLWGNYPLAKQKHAMGILCKILETDTLTKQLWITALDKALKIQDFINDQVYLSRKKDYDNPYLQAMYHNNAEMDAVISNIDDNNFIIKIKNETNEFHKLISIIKKRS